MVNIRTKGQNGEREAIRLLTDWATQVTDSLGLPPVVLTRNLEQPRGGGYDLTGIDWLAVEIKRHENLQVSQWWKQAVKQAKDHQIPFLMYRQNRTQWRFRLLACVYHSGRLGHYHSGRLGHYPVDMAAADAQRWFQTELWVRLRKGV